MADSQEEHAVAVHIVVDHMEDSLVDHMEVVLTEVVLMEVVLMAMEVAAKSEFQHSYLGIHHTTHFAH